MTQCRNLLAPNMMTGVDCYSTGATGIGNRYLHLVGQNKAADSFVKLSVSVDTNTRYRFMATLDSVTGTLSTPNGIMCVLDATTRKPIASTQDKNAHRIILDFSAGTATTVELRLATPGDGETWWHDLLFMPYADWARLHDENALDFFNGNTMPLN